MATRIYKPEEIVAKLRKVDGLRSEGMRIADTIREIGISEVTFFPWCLQYNDSKADQLKRLEDLDKENERLRRALSDLSLDKLVRKEAATKKILQAPKQRQSTME